MSTSTDCSSRMILFHNGHAAVLLFALTQSFVFASVDDDKNETQTLAQMAIGFFQSPWVEGVDSVIRPSESLCAKEVSALMQASKSGEMWALQMLDASSKIQSGILRGNIRDLGMYNECIEVNGRYNATNISGKYCTISIGVVSEENRTVISSTSGIVSSSLCVPSSCNETQVDQIVNAGLQSSSVISQFGIEGSRTSCVRVESEDFTTGEIFTIAVFSTVGAFMIFCTICDLLKRSKSRDTSVAVDQLAKFSLYTNGMALLSTKATPQTMSAIHGIRFLSMCWIVLGHRYVTSLLRPTVNLLDIPQWFNSWTAVYIQAAPFAVDTFFVVSGFLMSYLYLKSKKSGKISNFHMMYIHRYLRLTPCLAVLMLFVAFLLHRVANGPAREYLFAIIVNNCKKNWWINLLYTQNFLKKEEICLGHSWYLAVDMQLFWISPIILYPLYRWPKYGLGILSLCLMASVITPAVVLAVNGYSNAIIRLNMGVEGILHEFFEYYIPTYNRACPYFVGVFLGYDVVNNKRHLSRVVVAINWSVACILTLFCGWATHHIYNSNFAYNLVLESAFAIVLRPFWSIAIAWIVYACTQGYGGPVTRFLSLPLFLPLSRLSYCIYLVHIVIQATKNLTARTPGFFSDFGSFNDFWGDMMLSIAVAFILSLFFESPVIVLEKIITERSQKSKRAILVQRPKNDVEMGIRNKDILKY